MQIIFITSPSFSTRSTYYAVDVESTFNGGATSIISQVCIHAYCLLPRHLHVTMEVGNISKAYSNNCAYIKVDQFVELVELVEPVNIKVGQFGEPTLYIFSLHICKRH